MTLLVKLQEYFSDTFIKLHNLETQKTFLHLGQKALIFPCVISELGVLSCSEMSFK